MVDGPSQAGFKVFKPLGEVENLLKVGHLDVFLVIAEIFKVPEFLELSEIITQEIANDSENDRPSLEMAVASDFAH